MSRFPSVRSRSHISLAAALCILLGPVALPAFAADTTAPAGEAAEAGNEFRFGIGGIETPAYLGSEARRKLLVPLFGATFDNRFYVGAADNSGGGGTAAGGVGGGAGMFLHKDPVYTWTLGLSGDFSRKEEYAPELAGMGDRPAGTYLNSGAAWHSGIFHVGGGVGVGLRSGEGSHANFDVGLGGPIAAQWVGGFGISAEWANAEQNFFDYGISDSQAATRAALIAAHDPRLSPGEAGPFTPGAGWQRTGFGGALTYLFDKHWSLTAFANESQLRGPVLASPLVRTNHGASFGLFLGYHFRTEPSS